MTTPQDILTFWFEEIDHTQRFQKDENFDKLIAQRFLDTHTKGRQGELSDWRETIQGRLAEIIVLDQFSRNLYRDTPQAFAYDGMALTLTQEAIRTGDVKALSADERAFLYMPLMHSESAVIHQAAETHFKEVGLTDYLPFEISHKVIIDRFGRYPHRNAILGRPSTDEEIAFLKEPNSSF